MTTIIVVDDDAAVLGLTKRILESERFRVYAAGSAREAIEIAQVLHGDFHLLLTDMVMPVTDGHDLIMAIRGMFPKVKTMAISGAISSGDFRTRDYAVLQKPFSREELLAAVRKVLKPDNLLGVARELE